MVVSASVPALGFGAAAAGDGGVAGGIGPVDAGRHATQATKSTHGRIDFIMVSYSDVPRAKEFRSRRCRM